MTGTAMVLRSAIEKVEALNDAFLKDQSMSEAAFMGEVIDAVSVIGMMDFQRFGQVEPAGEGISLCRLHSSPSTVVLVAYLEPNAVLETHDHKDFIGAMRVLRGSLNVETFAYADGARPADVQSAALRREATKQYHAGDSAAILSDSGQIHRVAAGEAGAVFFDIYTMYKNPGSCRFYDMTDVNASADEFTVQPVADYDIH